MIKKILPAAIAAATLLMPIVGHAQTTGTDNAGNYTTGNYAGLNMGTGFGAFDVTTATGTAGYAGTFIGGSGTSIDTGGNSFGMYANSDPAATVTITRPFATALQNAGDSFSTQLRTDFSATNTGQAFNFTVGPATLALSATGYTFSGGTVVSTLTPSDYILDATFSVLAGNNFSFVVTGNQGTDAASVTGTLTGPVSQFQIVSDDTANNQYFNNLSVTNVAAAPEPGALVALLIGGMFLGGAFCVRRRKQTA